MAHRFNEAGEPIVLVKFDGEKDEYSLENMKDIFGRCEGEQVEFEKIEEVFDELWHGWRLYTFEEVERLMKYEGGQNEKAFYQAV